MKSECFALKKLSPQSELNKKFYLKSISIAPSGSQLKEKDWLARKLSVNSLRGKVLIDTGAGEHYYEGFCRESWGLNNSRS